MPSCCVPFCKSGYRSDSKWRKEVGLKEPSLFRINSEERLKTFSKLISRGDRPLQIGDRVCSEHFYPEDIEWDTEGFSINGVVVFEGDKRASPRLKDGALPKIFKNYPSYLNKKVAPKRSAPRERSLTLPRENAKIAKSGDTECVDDEMQQGASKMTSNAESFPTAPQTAFLAANIPNILGNESNAKPDVQQQPDLVDDATDQHQETHPLPLFPHKNIDLEKVKLPNKAWALHHVCAEIVIAKLGPDRKVTHCVTLKKEDVLQVDVGGVTISAMEKTVSTAEELQSVILTVDNLKMCEGTELGSHSNGCKGMCNKKALRCIACVQGMKNIRKKQRRMAKLVAKQKKKRQEKFRLKKSKASMQQKIKTMEGKIRELHKKFKDLKRDKILDLVQDLPEKQQQVVAAFLDAAKCKGPLGRRYKIEWIYECVLMRIRSSSLYKHLRLNNILPLPSKATLNSYMKKLRPTYGFQEPLFEVLKHKVADWPEANRHGALLIDEVKLAPGVSFNRSTLETTGFVDLGQHTPSEQKQRMGDHALVLLYQPFRGNWVQTVGCFLSKSNVKVDILTKLVLEGITLLENSELHVDAVVSDAAGWNRSMWTKLGIGVESSSSEHPHSTDPQRRLWFFSDWCHLLKCMRNAMCPLPPRKKPTPSVDNPDDPVDVEEASLPIPTKELYTPNGIVKSQHWVALLKEEEKRTDSPSQLQYCPNMKRKVVFPTGFQRMNVSLAFQFFSNSFASGMAWYRRQGIEALADSEASEVLISKVNAVADAMNSNGPKGALWPDSTQEKAIVDFQEYHKQCMEIARSKGKKCFWTEQTDLGLTVSLRSTIELATYLRNSLDYRYVMTARFNQDALEQFFGNVRRAAGPNNHPDPTLFAQLYRLLSVYSLVKPPKGSNVCGEDNVKALINAKDPMAELYHERRQEFENLMDEVLSNGQALDSLPLPCDIDHSYGRSSFHEDEPITRFMAGFTAHKKKGLTENCEACMGTLEKPHTDANSGDAFILTKEMYHLKLPSDELAQFVREMEMAVTQCLEIHGVHKDMLFTALKYLKVDPSVTIGCIQHSESIKKKIMKFYLIMRMFFATDRKNEDLEKIKDLRKGFNKRSKLI